MGGMSRRNGSNAWGASLAFAAAVLLAASPAPASPSAPAPPPEKPRLTGRAVVQVEPARRPQRVRERLSATLGAAGLRSEAVIPELGAAAVDIPRGWSVAALRRELAGEPGVVRVTPEYRRSPRLAPLIPNDPAWVTLDPAAPAGDFFQWNLARESFPGAWARSQGTGVEIAMIDTGIAATTFDASSGSTPPIPSSRRRSSRRSMPTRARARAPRPSTRTGTAPTWRGWRAPSPTMATQAPRLDSAAA